MTAPADRLAAALDAGLSPRVGERTPAQVRGVFDGSGLVRVDAAGALPPDPAQLAFRIASCTKSFTAASALLLADDGLLDLDEPLADALDVPLRLVGATGAAPTVRDALAMRGGFPTDDPWADRQESLSDDAFARLLGEGVRVMWPAGERFEYSNLGYAIAGRILGLRGGMPFRRLVESRLLEPLRLGGTGFNETVGAPAGVATGFRPGPDGWEAQPVSGPGAFSPIGGLFSTAHDLARWAALLAGFAEHSALPASVGERMRQAVTPVSGDPAGAWHAYGLGLMVRADAAGRRFVGHSGGYPGFTTRMEWVEGADLGAVVFENAGYTRLTDAVTAAFDAAFPAPAAPLAAATPNATPWPETLALAEATRAALAAGGLPDAALLDDCVGLDLPLPRRLAELAAQLDRIGGVTVEDAFAHTTPADAAWELRGPHGALRCRILVTPHASPRIQKLDVAPTTP
ncbi:serine hydrolase domain-containing protein [Protaetiibacter intestinalis]|uniref:Class A beta-lactamase-related serine hydrolase n=1 Tax=Protaetiibacter intestinalis TaxID=2419774 RepID=A0A387B9J7_9MICO|nr:serine hydrolase domain-containing protein [Protaetiibacter intestinalis]AYF97776.1 class A beta-lactamase-related serine hydrolase [Protaetiibacter intestinalis]